MVGPSGAADRGSPFFESERDRREVLRHLPTGVLPLKFAYTGSGAFTHGRFAASEEYQRTTAHVPLEMEALRRAPAPDEIVEIGPGTGRRTAELFARLAAGGRPWRRYLAIDVSDTLLTKACAALRAAAPSLAVTRALWDIEAGHSGRIEEWRRGEGPLTVCLFGHTLGNLESVIGALLNVRRSLRPGDRLVAGVTMNRPLGGDVLDPYRGEDFRAAVLEPLLAAGLTVHDLTFELEYAGGTVTGTATLRRPVRIGGLTLPGGHRVRCFRSRRFTRPQVDLMFDIAGWNVDDRRFDATGDHLVITAIKREGEVS
jgi:L-histidine N-alpha-methyltransferase